MNDENDFISLIFDACNTVLSIKSSNSHSIRNSIYLLSFCNQEKYKEFKDKYGLSQIDCLILTLKKLKNDFNNESLLVCHQLANSIKGDLYKRGHNES